MWSGLNQALTLQAVDGSSAINLDPPGHEGNSVSYDEVPPASSLGDVPPAYIRIVHHPHDPERHDTIIPIDGSPLHNPPLRIPRSTPAQSLIKPWSPFSTRPDYEIVGIAVEGLLKESLVKRLLKGAQGSAHAKDNGSYQAPYAWCTESNITLRSLADIENVLEKARRDLIQVRATPF